MWTCACRSSPRTARSVEHESEGYVPRASGSSCRVTAPAPPLSRRPAATARMPPAPTTATRLTPRARQNLLPPLGLAGRRICKCLGRQRVGDVPGNHVCDEMMPYDAPMIVTAGRVPATSGRVPAATEDKRKNCERKRSKSSPGQERTRDTDRVLTLHQAQRAASPTVQPTGPAAHRFDMFDAKKTKRTTNVQSELTHCPEPYNQSSLTAPN